MIETQQLTKRYGELTAVDAISFKLEPGRVLGFLGPNGAGKSTTMKMIAGFLTPTSGAAKVCGHDVVEDAIQAKRVLGYLPEGAPSYGEMTPRQFLGFVADVRGLSGARRTQRLDDVIERLHLNAVLEQPIETLSKGFKRRVGLAQAIVHDPQVLILDEPTDGLDPNQKHEVRTLIREMAPDKAIIVSTHILEEVEAVCTRAVVIARGRLLADETPAGLAARSRFNNAVFLRFAGPVDPAVLNALEQHPGVAAVEPYGADGVQVLPKDGLPIVNEISALLASYRAPVAELHIEHGRLDDVFRAITLGDQAAGDQAHGVQAHGQAPAPDTEAA
jgi:ABC-2 type transport system ATP-binding protein